jgi:hypothetical protein
MNLKLILLAPILFLLLSFEPVWANQPVISEFLTLNGSNIQDEDLEHSDWIEIQNTGTSAINLNGYYLTDNADNLTKWRFPELNLAAGKFLVVFASEKDRTDPAKPLHTNFKLSGSGEYLALVNPDGITITSSFAPQFPAQQEDVSYGVFNGQQVFFNPPSPGTENILIPFVQTPGFSKPRGYYSTAFYLSLQSPDPEAKIYYTTNGVRPTATNGTLYHEPVFIQTSTPFSAIAFKNGTASEVITNSYFFTDSILKQSNQPEGYPATWGDYETMSGVAIADYEMDPEVCDNPAYKPLFAEAFQSIPTVSIVTDPDNLFLHSTDSVKGGIYIYTGSDTGSGLGVGWERPASVEYFDPKAQSEFQLNCGIQLQGGQSRVPEKTPKHSFRLKFKSEYGPSKLNFPLFDSPDVTTEFNTLILRANYNYTWLHMTSTERKNAKYVQDTWAKDTQLAMGKPAAHSKFIHLFINGLYWGMYNICERIDKDFMNSYVKGKADDFDVIKDYAEIIDGNLTAWDAMMALANQGLADAASYQKIQGNNTDGTRNPLYEPYLDVENLIDYMLLNFYAGNNDWDHHNWIAARNRVEPGKGFRFFCWDAEVLFTTQNMNNTAENNANCPSRLFTKLKANPEFKILLADRIQQLFYGSGLLTPESVTERYLNRATEIEKAILGESARWGDYRRDVQQRDKENDLYTPDKYWVPQLNWLTDTYFPVRTDVVISQLRGSGLFPTIDAPEFSEKGGLMTSEFDLSMHANSGTIYYTVNGDDPRATGGAVASGVFAFTAPLFINGNAAVKARVKSGETWSALTEATFSFKDSTTVYTREYANNDRVENYPNPFKTETTIRFSLPKTSQVKIDIYTIQGKLVQSIFKGKLEASIHYQNWVPQNQEKGIYLYKIQTEDKTLSGKMVYLK